MRGTMDVLRIGMEGFGTRTGCGSGNQKGGTGWSYIVPVGCYVGKFPNLVVIVSKRIALLTLLTFIQYRSAIIQHDVERRISTTLSLCLLSISAHVFMWYCSSTYRMNKSIASIQSPYDMRSLSFGVYPFEVENRQRLEFENCSSTNTISLSGSIRSLTSLSAFFCFIGLGGTSVLSSLTPSVISFTAVISFGSSPPATIDAVLWRLILTLAGFGGCPSTAILAVTRSSGSYGTTPYAAR
ncbi:uncharacterized protein MELLADRAFT_90876 [Melampsora larici-populina 98AG31]|uniref:Uncharacterized protein n=1 Tax=Melampsora larici-populina (strain 98AG31 / pathotype 3-4-7) TaxID=747676 RepID=F4R7U6_MELLP|nr:uncharacterized protein MELLADRAFT_90876 [Melampsora larici-populina 98AG31]EGG11377.1 hypothetical protein MELLADRAFT_90876 [Melampsora larici-populina 98AG31]